MKALVDRIRRLVSKLGKPAEERRRLTIEERAWEAYEQWRGRQVCRVCRKPFALAAFVSEDLCAVCSEDDHRERAGFWDQRKVVELFTLGNAGPTASARADLELRRRRLKAPRHVVLLRDQRDARRT